MTTLRLLAVTALLASVAFAADRALVPAKVIGERISDRKAGGTAIGDVIINVPMPIPSSKGTAPPVTSPAASARVISVEVVDFIYDWEQIGGPRFPVIPDETIYYYQEKGKYIVERNKTEYEFVTVETRRK